jgi:hypothetical protein
MGETLEHLRAVLDEKSKTSPNDERNCEAPGKFVNNYYASYVNRVEFRPAILLTLLAVMYCESWMEL